MNNPSSRHPASFEAAQRLDRSDPLRELRHRFEVPPGVSYLAGNCVGLQPRRARDFIEEILSAWAAHGFRAYFTPPGSWLSYEQEYLVEPMAGVIGARPVETALMNGLTVNLHLMLTSFYRPVEGRMKILTEEEAFQSDRHALASQIRSHGLQVTDVIVPVKRNAETRLIDVEQIVSMLEERGHEIALVLLSTSDFRTGQVLDLARITHAARRQGCIVGFDLAHAVGNVELQLHDWGVDFAVWCNYKYMNGGPGCIGGCFVHQRHAEDPQARRLQGWWGNKLSSRFNFQPDAAFDANPGASGWQLSTPPLLSMAALRASLELFSEARMPRLREKSLQLGHFLQTLVDEHLPGRCRSLTPRHPPERGCQLTLRVNADPKDLQAWLLQHGVVCDAHGQDMLRIAPAPLYNRFTDVHRAVCLIEAYFEAHAPEATRQPASATLAGCT